MKVEILRTILLANPDPALPHWHFRQGQSVEITDPYLCKRLAELRVIAKDPKDDIVEKMVTAPANKMHVPQHKEVKNQEVGKKRGRPPKKKIQ